MNTITKINLSNVKKCNQYWEDMPETEKGRLCLKCSHTIIDFRNNTDAEIAQKHIFSEQKVCGLYRKEQLEFPVRSIEERKGNRWKALYIGLFSFLSWNHFGQEKKIDVRVEQTDKKLDAISKTILKKQEQDSTITKEKIVVSGNIRDEKQLPLPGAYVTIVGTNKGTSSDQDGFYKLDITDLMETQDTFKLVFGYLGYQDIILSHDKAIFEEIRGRKINVQFTEVVELSVFYIQQGKTPIHKRIWYKIRNTFKRK